MYIDANEYNFNCGSACCLKCHQAYTFGIGANKMDLTMQGGDGVRRVFEPLHVVGPV